MSEVVKTIIKRIEGEKKDIEKRDKVEYFIETKELYNRVVKFYFEVIKENESLLDLSNKECLTELEKLTHRTEKNKSPLYPLAYEVPAMFRRACINAAVGTGRSYYSNVRRYEEKKKKAESKGKRYNKKVPSEPERWNKSVVFYKGMIKDYDGKTVILKLYTGKSFVWLKFFVKGREIPEGWSKGCPCGVIKGDRIELHFPVEKKVEKVKKIKEQIENEDIKVCGVDLNLGNRQAVCVIIKGDGTEESRLFIGGGDYLKGRRKRLLGHIAVNRSKYGGVLPEDRVDNKRLWKKIRDIEDYESHRVSRRIVSFARLHGAKIIVFEHLSNLRPAKGKYSKRSNERRSYWLKSRIYKYAQYKAYEYGIITTRVNPKNTSRLCCYCSEEVYRHSENEVPVNYTCGAPLYTCPCGHRGNSDLSACRNVVKKLFIRYDKVIELKPKKACEETHRCSSALYSLRAGVEGQASGSAIFYPSPITAPVKEQHCCNTSEFDYAGVERRDSLYPEAYSRFSYSRADHKEERTWILVNEKT